MSSAIDYPETFIKTSRSDSRLFSARIIAELLRTDPDLSLVAYGNAESMVIAIGERKMFRLRGDCYSNFTGRTEVTGSAWRNIEAFLDEVDGQYVVGYLGFDLHSFEVKTLRRAGYPSAWLISPQLLLEIKGSNWKCHVGNVATIRETLIRASDEGDYSTFSHLSSFSAAHFDVASGESFTRKVRAAVDWISNSRRRVTIARKVVINAPIDMVYSLASSPKGPETSCCFYLRSPDIEFVGNSPELLAVGNQQSFKTYKLSGTFPRSDDPVHDAALRKEFLHDEKIRGEHESSIESTHAALAKIGRVLPRGMSVLELTKLRHLMTVFETQPFENRTTTDCLRAVFPSGTSAHREGLSCIAQIEGEGRGAYYGLVGVITPEKTFSFSQILRTIFRHKGSAFSWAGVAITRASTPDDEYRETCLKLSSIMGVRMKETHRASPA